MPAHSAARLMLAKIGQHNVITFMYNITYCLLVKTDITHMGYNWVITPNISEKGYNPTSELCDIHASPLLSHSRLLQDVSSLQRIESIINYYRPHICPLPNFTLQEAEMLSSGHNVDPTIDSH